MVQLYVVAMGTPRVNIKGMFTANISKSVFIMFCWVNT